MFNETPTIEEVIKAFKIIEISPTIYCGCGSNIRTCCAYECQIIEKYLEEKYLEERRETQMLLSGKIEVFKNKKGYLTGILKSFDKDNNLLGKMFVSVNIRDEKLAEKVVEGKTLTFDVETGYLDCVHVELETESFEKISISIVKAKVVKVFPEEPKKTTKKSKKTTK